MSSTAWPVGLSTQHLTRRKSRWWQGCMLIWNLWGRICFKAHSDHWLNSVTCGCRTEVPISFLAITQGPLSSLRPPTFFSHVSSQSSSQQECVKFPCFKLLWFSFLPSTSYTSAGESTLLLRDYIIRLDSPGWSPFLKVNKTYVPSNIT